MATKLLGGTTRTVQKNPEISQPCQKCCVKSARLFLQYVLQGATNWFLAGLKFGLRVLCYQEWVHCSHRVEEKWVLCSQTLFLPFFLLFLHYFCFGNKVLAAKIRRDFLADLNSFRDFLVEFFVSFSVPTTWKRDEVSGRHLKSKIP